jgi:tetratricopeptide (TPR) repeat protein
MVSIMVLLRWSACAAVLVALHGLFAFAAQARPDDVDVEPNPPIMTIDLLQKALAARRRGDLDAAIGFYTEAIATRGLSSTDLALVLARRGSALEIKGETGKAIEDYNEAIRLKPDYGTAYIYRGLVVAKQHEYRRAIDDFTTAAARDSSVAYLAWNDRANAYEAIGEYDQAIEDYGRAIQSNPSYASAYFNRAGVYYARADYDRAIDDYGRAIDLRPGSAHYYSDRGIAYQARGDFDKAIADFDSAIRIDPYDAAPLGNRGMIYAANGQFERAIADFTSAITLEPGSGWPYTKRAQASLYSGEANAAIADLKVAITLNPSDAYTAVWLYLADKDANGSGDASSELTRAATKVDRNSWPGVIVDLYLGLAAPDKVRAAGLANTDPDSRSERECQVTFYLGMFELDQGDKSEARHRLQEASDICPSRLFERVAAKTELTRLNPRQQGIPR